MAFTLWIYECVDPTSPALITCVYFVDIDECVDPNSCQHHCENTEGAYVCSCIHGYKLASDKRTCVGEIHSVLTMPCIHINEKLKIQLYCEISNYILDSVKSSITDTNNDQYN